MVKTIEKAHLINTKDDYSLVDNTYKGLQILM